MVKWKIVGIELNIPGMVVPIFTPCVLIFTPGVLAFRANIEPGSRFISGPGLAHVPAGLLVLALWAFYPGCWKN